MKGTQSYATKDRRPWGGCQFPSLCPSDPIQLNIIPMLFDDDSIPFLHTGQLAIFFRPLFFLESTSEDDGNRLQRYDVSYLHISYMKLWPTPLIQYAYMKNKKNKQSHDAYLNRTTPNTSPAYITQASKPSQRPDGPKRNTHDRQITRRHA
jgi:hypothetical protein